MTKKGNRGETLRGLTMSKITLVGKLQARVGYTFLYAGDAPECKECKLYKLCHALREGWTYEVVKVRGVTHTCPVHEEGAAVVEVKELPLHLAIPRKEAIEGAIITVEGRKCKDPPPFSPGDERYLVCCNSYLKRTRVKIVKIIGTVDCREGDEMVEVALEAISQ